MNHKIRMLLNCQLRTSNNLSLGVWGVSNILTHISHFPYWIVVISSSFMCFNKFLECTDELIRRTEIEVKKHENKVFWSKDKLHSRTSAGHSPNWGDRPPKSTKLEFSKAVTGRSPNTSQSASQLRSTKEKKQSDRRSFAANEPNDRPALDRTKPIAPVVRTDEKNDRRITNFSQCQLGRSFARMRRTTAKARVSLLSDGTVVRPDEKNDRRNCYFENVVVLSITPLRFGLKN